MHGVPVREEKWGRERCGTAQLPRHRHCHAYATLVLAGRYLEAGDSGRYRVEAGNVLIHRPFEAHRNEFGARGAEVLNLPLSLGGPANGAMLVDNADEIVRLAERDVHAAAERLWVAATTVEHEADWPDLLATQLRDASPPSLSEWAREYDLDPATVSRGFAKAFGTTPSRYRAEARTRLALRAIASGPVRLVDVALQLGFADQAHMTRSVAAMTGSPPRRWRDKIKWVQETAERPL